MFYIVGVTETCQRLAVCRSCKQATKFISTLPDHEHGIYYIDECYETVVLTDEIPPPFTLDPELAALLSDLESAVEDRRNDPEFMGRLAAIVNVDQETLDRLR